VISQQLSKHRRKYISVTSKGKMTELVRKRITFLTYIQGVQFSRLSTFGCNGKPPAAHSQLMVIPSILKLDTLNVMRHRHLARNVTSTMIKKSHNVGGILTPLAIQGDVFQKVKKLLTRK
jgi:hypothetical protein